MSEIYEEETEMSEFDDLDDEFSDRRRARDQHVYGQLERLERLEKAEAQYMTDRISFVAAQSRLQLAYDQLQSKHDQFLMELAADLQGHLLMSCGSAERDRELLRSLLAKIAGRVTE